MLLAISKKDGFYYGIGGKSQINATTKKFAVVISKRSPGLVLVVSPGIVCRVAKESHSCSGLERESVKRCSRLESVLPDPQAEEFRSAGCISGPDKVRALRH